LRIDTGTVASSEAARHIAARLRYG